MKDLISLLSMNEEKEKEIFRTEDHYGPVLVLQYGNQRILSFDSRFEQSAMLMDRPLTLVHEYLRAMVLVLAFKNPEHITLLGLGGGALLRALHARCPDTRFQAVELRDSVIQVAREHFGLPSDDRINILQRNGFTYLQEAGKHLSDIIFADMYEANAMQPLQGTTRFLEQCWQLLTRDGWVVINFHKMPAFNHPYMLKLRRLFAEVFCCDIGNDNSVVFCGKQSLRRPLIDFGEEIRGLEQRFETELFQYFNKMIKIRTDGLGRLTTEGGTLTEEEPEWQCVDS